MEFFGRPDLPQDIFRYNNLELFVNYDRRERIVEWRYESEQGPIFELERAGRIVTGMTLQEAWLASSNFDGIAHALYYQFGRLLGYFGPRNEVHSNTIICRCFGISEQQLLDEIIANSEVDALKLRKATRAGAGCGSCLVDMQTLIQSYCDEKAIASSYGKRPLGLNPLEFLVKLAAAWQTWQKQFRKRSDAQFIGIDGYKVFVKCHKGDQEVLEEFAREARAQLRANFSFDFDYS